MLPGVQFVAVLGLISYCFAVEQGQLDIKLNEEFARRDGGEAGIIFGSIVTIEGLATWTDGNILDLAQAAHVDMLSQYNELYKQKNSYIFGKGTWKRGAPSVTAVLVIDNTAYISSSMRGFGYIYEGQPRWRPAGNRPTKDTPSEDIAKDPDCFRAVGNILQKCQLANNDQPHMNEGKCGEVMAALAYCGIANGVSPDWTRARTIAVDGRPAKDKLLSKNDVNIKPPCGKDSVVEGRWGCYQWTKELGVPVIEGDIRADPRELPTVPAPVIRHAIYP